MGESEMGDGEQRSARSYSDLRVWQRAHGWVLGVYEVSGGFPRHEVYGLTAQMRRAAVSVPANIAEGFRRRSLADKARFLNIAQASLDEADYYLILATDLGYADCTELRNEASDIARMLGAYTARIRSRT